MNFVIYVYSSVVIVQWWCEFNSRNAHMLIEKRFLVYLETLNLNLKIKEFNDFKYPII